MLTYIWYNGKKNHFMRLKKKDKPWCWLHQMKALIGLSLSWPCTPQGVSKVSILAIFHIRLHGLANDLWYLNKMDTFCHRKKKRVKVHTWDSLITSFAFANMIVLSSWIRFDITSPNTVFRAARHLKSGKKKTKTI